MFTGLVEATGCVLDRKTTEKGMRWSIDRGDFAPCLQVGDSLAVNGCCLTIEEIASTQLTFHLLGETMKRTNLIAVPIGHAVNLERALPCNGRLGGHFLTGHVDVVASILQWTPVDQDYLLEIELPPAYQRYIVPQGCVAVDGISLTVVEVRPSSFTLWIIPHTREKTTLHERLAQERVNLEFDLLAKYTEKILAVGARGFSSAQ